MVDLDSLQSFRHSHICARTEYTNSSTWSETSHPNGQWRARYSTTADPGRYRPKRSLRLPIASASKTIQTRLCRLSPECGVPGISRIHVRIRPSLAFFKVSRSVANEYPFQVLFKSKTSRTIRREQRLPNTQPLRSPFEKQDPIVLHHGGKPIPLDVHPQPREKLANDAQHQIRQSKPFLSQTSRDIPSPCCQTFLS
ncbi:hypothetical protein CABS01_12936 [Colletotrichum abscissum]|uniref:uncharacterized protein n=1 Tax=Colletotrichum abscissum TaxID=1671311 RepID=UPI0027D6AE1C|nr:uncharacterized protein CABS01_12936 [Colletotrichum abscissum]KAK1487457.1 hypothetical protein CABS01_12936 [Colletotrichum abscissum]